MNSYIKVRTFIALAIIAIFAFAIYPLTPKDFYETLKKHSVKGKEKEIENIILEAKNLQQKKPELFPASAILDVADSNKCELKNLTSFSQAVDNSDVISQIRKKTSSSIRLGLDLNGGVEFVLHLVPDVSYLTDQGYTISEAKSKLKNNFNQYRDKAMEALRKRLESRNIFETEITPFANSGLSLKAPIVSKDEKENLQKLITSGSKLEFRLVHKNSHMLLQDSTQLPLGYEILKEVTSKNSKKISPSYVVARQAVLTGRAIEQAYVSKNQYGALSIALKFTTAGAQQFAKITGENIGSQLAIILDGKLYCAPTIQGAIAGGQAEITGSFSSEEASNIADALSSGSFPFTIEVAAVYDTAPTLGADNVTNGIRAGLAALALLAIFMIVYYKFAGVIAVFALSLNVVLILGAMAAFNATLTMPGIAGIILTLGMAVDANVLVFERMREEIDKNKPTLTVISQGFQRAYSSVLDGNLTTLAVAMILAWYGTGAIKGFAVSLSIGILSSLFTALFVSRICFDYLIKYKPDIKFNMLRFFSKSSIPFLKQSKVAIIISIVLIIASLILFYVKGNNMLSVDFTGGTLISCNYDKYVPVSKLEDVLMKNKINGKITYKSNASQKDNKKFEVLLQKGYQKKIQVGQESIENKIINILNKQYPELAASSGQSTTVGGMVGVEMTKNAIISIILAFIGMIIYVAIRYEFIYALTGILALVHDVIISLGIFILLGREMSLPVVAGLLTIIGYSINDTIVIFDRIREEHNLHPNLPLTEIIDDSLNKTLSRTLLTSLTTFIVVIVMFFLGGIAINDFMLIIGLGIIIGSYSSLYIASPFVVAFHNVINKIKNKKELKNE